LYGYRLYSNRERKKFFAAIEFCAAIEIVIGIAGERFIHFGTYVIFKLSCISCVLVLNIVVNSIGNWPASESNIIFCLCPQSNPETIGFCEVIYSADLGPEHEICYKKHYFKTVLISSIFYKNSHSFSILKQKL
jgi:hypothetical protein